MSRNKQKDIIKALGQTFLNMKPDQLTDIKKCKPTLFNINKNKYYLFDGEYTKVVIGNDYNYIFDKRNGDFKRWGKTINDDPQFSPIGPEILDIEISINGCPNGCAFCSPSGTLINTPNGVNPIENIKVGDEVIGFNVDGNKIEHQKVVEIYERDYSGDMIDIHLDNNRTLSLTPDHEVFTKEGWKFAKDLKDSDEILSLV